MSQVRRFKFEQRRKVRVENMWMVVRGLRIVRCEQSERDVSWPKVYIITRGLGWCMRWVERIRRSVNKGLECGEK